MKIQVNTDNNIKGREELAAYVQTLIKDGLDRFDEQITRVEVYLSDENSHKEGPEDKRCLLEARLVGLDPVVVSHLALTLHQAVDGATAKMKKALTSAVEKQRAF